MIPIMNPSLAYQILRQILQLPEHWAVDVLHDAGAQVHLAHPSGVKGFTYRRVKNDVRDAADAGAT